jgi:hypothetical protein
MKRIDPKATGFSYNLCVHSGVDKLHDALLEGRNAVRVIEALGRAKKVSELWAHLWSDSLRMVIMEATEALETLEKFRDLKDLEERGYQVKSTTVVPELPKLEPVVADPDTFGAD